MSRPARRWKFGSGPKWRLPKHLARRLPVEQRALAGIIARRKLVPYSRLNYYLECLFDGGRFVPGRDLVKLLLKDGRIDRETARALRKEARAGAKVVRLGPYELLARIGEGGMGGVYAALDTRTGKRFAVKVLRKSLAGKRDFLRRFFKEASAALNLRHPNIVAGIDVGEAEGFHFFVMEYIEGKDCDEMVRVNGPFETYEALKIIREVAKALDYAHRKGFVHRDVKPANIVVGADGRVKLADFGLVKDLTRDSRLTQAGMTMGTPHFISPEQAKASGKVDHRSDIYSLGATLYFLLTGRPPFDGDTPSEIAGKQVRAVPKPVRYYAPAVPKVVERLVEAMMAKSPKARYASARDLRLDVEAIMDGREPRRMPAAVKRSSGAASDVRPGHLRAMLTGSLLGAALVLSSVAGYFLWLQERLPHLYALLKKVGVTMAQTLLPYLER